MDFTLGQLCWLTFAVVALVLVVKTCLRYGITPALVNADEETRTSLLLAARIKRHWTDVAPALGLAAGTTRQKWDSRRRVMTTETTATVPHLATTADEYGVRLRVSLNGVVGVGAAEFTKKRQQLADAWGVTRVSVVQPSPSVLDLRAVRRDPLIFPTELVLTDEQLVIPPATLDTVTIGLDEYAEVVSIRLKGNSGVTINGLPGSGKSSLVNNVLRQLAPSPAVQMGVLNGKGDGEYDDMADRLMFSLGDELEPAHAAFLAWTELRRWRAANIRRVLGTKNFWDVGPSEEWPLCVLVVDECQTYLQQVKADSGDKVMRARNALTSQIALMGEDNVKKGRSLGMLTIWITQKGTGDAIPTAIRDNCGVGLSFALRSAEAAKAALGDDISAFPDASPVGLQGPEYIGVCTMVAQGRSGFVRVRVPYVQPELVEHQARLTGRLNARPKAMTGDGLVLALTPGQSLDQLPSQLPPGVSEPDDLDGE